MQRHLRKKTAIVLALALFILLTLIKPLADDLLTQLYYKLRPAEGIQCYRSSAPSLPSITDETVAPNSIFFHETSCRSHAARKLVITARQACAVESAARHNPARRVYLLYAAPGRIHPNRTTESDRHLAALAAYPNVRVRHLDYAAYTRRTPLERLYSSGALDGSRYAKSHASDLLRYLTLWKYGGIYLDLDVVVLRPFDARFPANFAGIESDEVVAAGALGFGGDAVGRRMAAECVAELGESFSGREWGSNGPGVVTRVLERWCGGRRAREMVGGECGGFRVFGPEVFYPVEWREWERYFRGGEEGLVGENCMAIHVWNKHSAGVKIKLRGEGEEVPYLKFAKENCPKVVQECDEFF